MTKNKKDKKMFKDESKKRIYGYKLCDDITITSPQKVNGILLKKEKYYEVQNRIEKLESYIRSSENPFGILEMIMYDSKDLSKEDIFSRRRSYTSDELFAMRVPQLNDICETWDIDCIRKSKNKVVEELLNKFRIEKESKAYYYSEPNVQDINIEEGVINEGVDFEKVEEEPIYDNIDYEHLRVSSIGSDFVVTEPEEINDEILEKEHERLENENIEIKNFIDDEKEEKSFLDYLKPKKDNGKNKRFKIGL